MTNEIKEIIELINIKYKDYYIEDFLSGENVKKLVDYITNLQEENEKIKEYQESYRKELDFWRIQFSNKEDRINKAIEYIDNNGMLDLNGYDLLDILRGVDNE